MITKFDRTYYMCIEHYIVNCIRTSDVRSYCSDLRTQVGSLADHWPLARHTRFLAPSNRNPGLQMYVARAPGVVPMRNTCPLVGSSNVLQPRTACVGGVVS